LTEVNTVQQASNEDTDEGDDNFAANSGFVSFVEVETLDQQGRDTREESCIANEALATFTRGK